MSSIGSKIKLIFTDATLRRKVIFVIVALFLFRLLSNIPIPGIDPLSLEQFFSDNQFLGLLNIFSGGGLSSLSIVMLGVGPFITASIIMQLLTVMVPKLKSMYHDEGEAGRKKFSQYSRLLTVPLGILQAIAFLILLQRQFVISNLTTFDFITNVIIVTAGSLLLTWIGELINEYGIGNGVSLLIFAGIIAVLPTSLQQLVVLFDPTQIPVYLGFLVATFAIIWGVVVVSEAERPIPITYAKRVRGGSTSAGGVSTYLPLRVNQAGVMPIIFALSILLFPQMLASFFLDSSNATLANISDFVNRVLSIEWLYGVLYFVLVFLFTYFYTAITFEPESVATNLQKSGAFVPGVRPGRSTEEYIGKVLTRITFIGAVFLGLIAVLPIIMQQLTGIQTLTIGGTAMLIVVAVIIDLIKRIDAQVAMREY